MRAHAHAGAGVGVHHAAGVGPRFVHGAVNDEACGVHREGRVVQLVALHVHLDQARRGDLVEHQAIGVDEEMVLTHPRHRFGQLGADVGEDQVAPSVQGHQAVAGGKVAPQLPFFGADDFLEGGDVHGGSFL